MSIILDVIEALRTKGGYTVDTELTNKETEKQLYVLLDSFEPTRETPNSYTPYITYNIKFYYANSTDIEDIVVDIMQCVHDNVKIPHMNFEDVQINDTNNDIEVVLKLKFYRVINFG